MNWRGDILKNKKIAWGKQSGNRRVFSIEKSAFNFKGDYCQ